MKKRVLSLLLCIVLSLSLVPTAAFAAEGDAPASEAVTSVSTPAGDASNLCITKSVADNHDGTYSLTMEAYATGASSTKYTNVPLDIVLVLDVSGSMDDSVTAVSYKAEKNASYTYRSFKNTKLFYKADDGQYYRVYRDYNLHLFSDNEYYLYYTDINGNTHVLGHTANNEKATLYTGVLYSEITATSTNMAVMQDAAKKFIGTVAANAKTNDVDHKISIVKFAGTEKDSIGNNAYDEGWYTYNYTQIVKSLTSVKDNAAALNTTIDQLTPGGATSVDYAMNRASAALADSSEGRQKIVVVFTDGEPNHSSGFKDTVANDAIGKAKALKDDDTIIYTVGLIQNPGDKVTSFLNYLSSNYPTATSMSSHGTKAADSNYAMMADDGASLDSVFQTIAQDAISSSSKADETSILADTPTHYFKLALGEDGELASCTAKKVPCTGDGEWGTPIDITNQIHVTHEDQTIMATGYNYTAQDNIVVEKTDGSWQGNKLVLTFTIVPDPDATWDAGEHYYDTNNTTNSKAGIYNGEEPLIQLDSSPNVPIVAYTVTYVVDGDAPESCTGMPESSTATYLPGKQITVAGGLTTTSNVKDGIHGIWTFEGWDRTGSFSMPAENVTITGRWTFTPDTHTVTFNAGDHGTIGNDQTTISGTYTDGDAYPEAPSTTPENHYEFDGWVNEAGEKVGSFPATVTADATYTATWKQVSTDPSHFDPKAAYKVEYYKEQLDGSYTLVAADSTMAFGDLGDTVTATVKDYEHYTLNEGMSNQSGKIIMPSLDSDNQLQILTLKLYYDLDSYTVTYKVDGEQVGNVETYKYGENVIIRDKYSKDGYDVTDWSITENFNMPANDVVITATTSAHQHTVTYYVDGEQYGESENHRYGDTVGVVAAPTKEGYTFSGWTTRDADISSSSFSMPDKDVVINGNFTANQHKVTYKVDGEVVGEAVPYNYGDTVTVLPTYVKEGYSVDPWTSDDVSISTGSFSMPDKDVVIETNTHINSYTVTYFVDDEQVGEEETYNYGETVNVADALTKEGYTFSGWSTDDATITDGSFSMPANDVVINGSFTVNSYTVTYKVDGVQVGEVETYAFGEAVIVRDAYTKEGYTVSDWDVTEDFQMPAEDVEIHATSSVKSYTVTYFVDDEQVGEEETYNYGETVIVRDAYTKEGYTVSDWDVTEDFTMPAEDVEIHATSSVNRYTVTYFVDDEQVGEVETYAFGEAVTVRPVYVKEGYTVSDWSKTDFIMPASDVEIYATSSSNEDPAPIDPDPVDPIPSPAPIDPDPVDPVPSPAPAPVDPDVPATGDTMNMGIWITMMAVASVGMAAMFVYSKKKEDAE